MPKTTWSDLHTSSRDRRIGSRLQSERERQGISQPELTQRLASLGVPMSDALIRRIEHGTRPLNLAEIDALARALEVPEALFLPYE